MKSLSEYIFEVSKETAESAAKKAHKEITSLLNAFKKSDFTDDEILSKIRKRARQYKAFNQYVEDINNETFELVTSDLKKVIEKWKDGRELSDGNIFKPEFILTTDWAEMDRGRFHSSLEIEKLNNYLWLDVLLINLKEDDENYDEYKKVNDELISDLKNITGIDNVGTPHYSTRMKKFGTIVLSANLDINLVDWNKVASKFGGKSREKTKSGYYDIDKCYERILK